MVMTRKWRSCVWRTAAALALLAGLAAPVFSAIDVSAQEELPSVAAAAPESTLLFHALDLDRDGTQWQLTEELLARVGLPDALDLWEESILEEGAKSGDFTQADLDALLGGEMAIVITPQAVERALAIHASHRERKMGLESGDATPVAQTGDPGRGAAAILVPGDPDAAWDYVQRQFTDLAAEQSVELEVSEYGEAELLVIAPPDVSTGPSTGSDDAKAESMHGLGLHSGGKLVAARGGDYIIVGAHKADVSGILDVIDGNSASLADSSEAQAVAAELPADALSFTYVDGEGIVDALGPDLTEMLQSSMVRMSQEAWSGQFGLAISADEPGFRFDTIAIPSADADLDSVLVENDPAVAAKAERAPAGTFAFQAGRLPETAYAGAPYLLAQAVNDAMAGGEQNGHKGMMDVPTPEEMEEEIATAEATLGFDPAADLFDLLGYEFIAFSSFPSISFENFGVDAVIAVSTTDPDALAETATKIAALIDRSEADADVSTRRVDGETVYVVAGAETAVGPAVEFGVVEDQAVISIGGGIEDLIAEPAASLAQDPQFQTVMGLLPDEYYEVGYVDISQAIDSIVLLMGVMGGMDAAEPAATPVATANGPENIRALGAVAFQREDMAGSSAILYIAEP